MEITRDESAFYRAETQSLTRENQMLKVRIRELGKFLKDGDIHHKQALKGIMNRATDRRHVQSPEYREQRPSRFTKFVVR